MIDKQHRLHRPTRSWDWAIPCCTLAKPGWQQEPEFRDRRDLVQVTPPHAVHVRLLLKGTNV